MTDREDAYQLKGKIQINDVFLGGERSGGKVDLGSENKITIVSAFPLNEAGIRSTPDQSRERLQFRSDL